MQKLKNMKLKNFNFLRIITFTLLFLIVPFYIQAQNKPLGMPKIFSSYLTADMMANIYDGTISLEREARDESVWYVYSDRDGNELTHKNGASISSKNILTLMEKCHVLELSGTKLRVRTIDKEKEGWIEARRLILSPYAAIRDKSGTTKRAMILTSVSDLTPEAIKEYQDAILEYKFYNQPKFASENKKKAKKFEFYYVLKTEGIFSLLSTVDKFQPNISTKELLPNVKGWFKNLNLTEWNHRVCYEIQYGREVQQEYKDSIIPVFVEDEIRGMKKIRGYYHYNKKVNIHTDLISKQTIPATRLNTYIMRMPLLEHKSKEPDIQLVAQILNLDKNKHNQLEEQKAEALKNIELLKKKSKKINLFFVIDATSSMRPYYGAIAQSIEEIINLGNQNDIGGYVTQTRFGYALYRDYPDSRNGEDYKFGSKLVGQNQLENLKSQIRNENCHSVGTTIAEAQYQGLIKGIHDAKFDLTQSNLVILIGDVGNHRNDNSVKLKQVVDSLAKYEASLIAFQAINGTDPSYMDFNFDVQDYLRGAATASKYNVPNSGFALNSTEEQNTYKIRYTDQQKSETYRMFGRFSYANVNQAMDPNILVQNINIAILEYLKGIEKKISQLTAFANGDMASPNDVKGTEAQQAFFDWLLRRGFTEEDIKLLTELGDVSSRGYTSKNMYPWIKTYAYYPVVFMSKSELDDIKRVIKGIRDGRQSNSKMKENFMRVLNTFAQRIIGISEQEAGDLTLNQVWEVILGIPLNNTTYGNIKISNISQMGNDEFDNFYKLFDETAGKLYDGDFSASSFTKGEQTFYWIPLEDLMGEFAKNY